MRSKVIHFLDDYARFCPSERKYTLAGNSFYFKIYVFTKESLDIVKELDTEHELKKEDYGEFCNWIDSEDGPFILKCSKKKKKRANLTFAINSLKIATPMAGQPVRKFSILYYFNDENIDLKKGYNI